MAETVAKDALARILALDGKEQVIGGELLTIKPFSLRQIIDAGRLVDELSDKGVVDIAMGEGKTLPKFNFAKMLLRGGDSILKILSIASGKEVQWLGQLNPVDGVKLCSLVWEVNADFFDQNKTVLMEVCGPVLVTIKKVIADWILERVLEQPQSSDSSAPGTASKRSRATRSTK